MQKFSRTLVSRLLMAALCMPLAAQSSLAQISLRTVKVLGSKDVVEIEVEASQPIVPQTQVLTEPDRLVIDFPNAVPGSELRSQSVYRGEVKDMRIGLFQAKPPVTRIVLDLTAARSYQIFPNGRTVTIKVTGAETPDTSAGAEDVSPEPATRPGLVVANYTTRAEPTHAESAHAESAHAQAARFESHAKPGVEVSYRDGLLGIKANKVSLSEVLFAVQQRTGAEIPIPAGAEQEKIAVEIAPAPAPEVMARLLNGSRFNFLILSAEKDPRQLERVILTPRPEGEFVPAPVPAQNDDVADDEQPSAPIPAAVQAAQRNGAAVPVQLPPASQPEMKAPPEETSSD